MWSEKDRLERERYDQQQLERRLGMSNKVEFDHVRPRCHEAMGKLFVATDPRRKPPRRDPGARTVVHYHQHNHQTGETRSGEYTLDSSG